MPLEDFIITVFCCIESILQEIMREYPLRQRGFAPKLSDSVGACEAMPDVS
jgi:hypothetical protein